MLADVQRATIHDRVSSFGESPAVAAQSCTQHAPLTQSPSVSQHYTCSVNLFTLASLNVD